jgi:hypothetical protein
MVTSKRIPCQVMFGGGSWHAGGEVGNEHEPPPPVPSFHCLLLIGLECAEDCFWVFGVVHLANDRLVKEPAPLCGHTLRKDED